MLRQNYTATIERDRLFEGEFASEPYECGWASEAVFFVRKLKTTDSVAGTQVKVQISPDGIRWCDEGTIFELTSAEVDFIRVKHFGNWLRVVGQLPEGVSFRGLISLSLKG